MYDKSSYYKAIKLTSPFRLKNFHAKVYYKIPERLHALNMCLSNNFAECFLLNETVQFLYQKRESLYLSKIQGTTFGNYLGPRLEGWMVCNVQDVTCLLKKSLVVLGTFNICFPTSSFSSGKLKGQGYWTMGKIF